MRELIYNQAQIPKDKWRYGFRSSASTGCGWIAVSNALVRMGYDVDVEKLIRCFERQLPLIHGNAGTLVFGPFRLLKKWGFPVTITADPRQFDRVCKSADMSILFYFWRSGLRVGRHFVAVEYREGNFIGYNTYYNSLGPDSYGPSLRDFLKQQGFFGAVLTGISKKPPASTLP